MTPSLKLYKLPRTLSRLTSSRKTFWLTQHLCRWIWAISFPRMKLILIVEFILENKNFSGRILALYSYRARVSGLLHILCRLELNQRRILLTEECYSELSMRHVRWLPWHVFFYQLSSYRNPPFLKHHINILLWQIRTAISSEAGRQ